MRKPTGARKKEAISTGGRTKAGDVLPPGVHLSHRLDWMSKAAMNGGTMRGHGLGGRPRRHE